MRYRVGGVTFVYLLNCAHKFGHHQLESNVARTSALCRVLADILGTVVWYRKEGAIAPATRICGLLEGQMCVCALEMAEVTVGFGVASCAVRPTHER